jgi:hypothetical protein
MRQLKLTVEKAGKKNTTIEVTYLKDGEWHSIPATFNIPTGPYPIPEGSFTLLYPDDFDRGE